MQRKPVIGILTNVLVTDGWPYSKQERIYVNAEYNQAVEAAGGIPVMLPLVRSAEAVAAQAAMVDGVLLSGGFDVNPLLYGEEPAWGLESTFPEIDDHQIAVFHAARKLNKPMLGICRGMQVMNVAMGGTLYQDLATQLPESIRHQQRAKGMEPTHTVEVAAGTWLEKALGSRLVMANSYHHQSVKQVGQGFVVSAAAKDGVVEAIEKVEDGFMAGVQWHPEMMSAHHAEMARLFEAFIRICSI